MKGPRLLDVPLKSDSGLPVSVWIERPGRAAVDPERKGRTSASAIR